MIVALSLVAGLLPHLAAGLSTSLRDGGGRILTETVDEQFRCELPPLVKPPGDGLPTARDVFSGKEALKLQVERHAAIVKIPSISYDDNGEPLEDPRWDIFYTLHDTLESLYPNVHRRMSRETVNTLGLVYTIRGTDSSLKPLMLAAHQDVVPVADDATWSYPPFSGHFDGRWLWGRGASDDKNSLTGLMSALETLLSHPSWVPKRTIILALGFDEECSGRRGAGTIGPHLEQVYGQNSMALVLDEGGMGLELLNDTLYALPAVMEKGHIDVWLELRVNGGHSSAPFPHTGIGIMAEIVTQLEAHPWKPKLIENSPIHKHYICQAKYSPEALPGITELVNKGDLDSLAQELVKLDRSTHYRLQTSQAIDYFLGGVKINAMPEHIKIGVNHRIAPQDSIPAVKANILEQIRPIVKKFALTVKAFEGEQHNPDFHPMDASSGVETVGPMYEVEYNGTLILTSSQPTLVTPVSPTTGQVWDVFSGTVQHTFAFDGGKVVPVGELMTGNTDTRHYLNLSRNIYRWVPMRQGHALYGHTVDERIDMENHMEVVRFYYDLIRNFDASDAASVEEISEVGEL